MEINYYYLCFNNNVNRRKKKPMKFKAYDKINKKKIDLYRISLAKDGSPISVIDLDGEHYGMHQARLIVSQDKKKVKRESR